MTESPNRPLLSIIIPAYNEAGRLPLSLEQVEQFVAEQDYTIEVILVDNNSTDETPRIARAFAEKHTYARTLHEPIPGKGAAVRAGLQAGVGDYLFMCDADFSMPVSEIARFMPPAMSGYDVAIASREADGAQRIDEPEYRHLMGRVFNLIVRMLAIPKIQDTQCGFKFFRRDVIEIILPKLSITGWAFDVELLFLALKHGYRIIEVPITWYYMPQSRISPIRDSFEMLIEVLKIRLNWLLGRYKSA
nr:glycosyltransferase family 2 protein [Anaerolineae bacterium]